MEGEILTIETPGKTLASDFKKIIILFIYFWLCCIGFSLVAKGGGHSLVAVCGFLIAVAFLVVEHGLQPGFSSCGSWAQEHWLSSCCAWAELLHGIWDLPGSGTEPEFAALAGGFFTTEPPGKPHQ